MASAEDRSAEKPAEEQAPVAPPCALVIFGAAGDLTKRLVVPALYDLTVAKQLSEQFRLVGVDLAAKTTEQWRQDLTTTMHSFVTQGGGEFHPDLSTRPPGNGLVTA